MVTFFSLGLVRGIIGQVIGFAIGYGLVAIVRSAQGLEQHPDLGIFIGAVLGLFGFLLAAGVFSDWLKWIRGIETPLRHGPQVDAWN